MSTRCKPRLKTIALASAAIAIACAVTTVHATTVYKCKQPSGAVEYQDYPCKGGSVVDIKPDAANPDAIRRLREADEEFNRAAAERKADEERRQMIRDSARTQYAPVEMAQNGDATVPADYYGYDYGGYYAPYWPARDRDRVKPPKRVEHHRNVQQHRVPAVIRVPHPG